ncbi:DUF4123 domain-containing protein, partial [Massilia glaciei]
MTSDVAERLAHLQQEQPALRLYALVDGAQFKNLHGDNLKEGVGLFPLFSGTSDAPLAHAGPWLVDAELADACVVTSMAALEMALPAVTWLIAPQDLRGLTQLLQLKLDIELPDQRKALLRFWDPRVLAELAGILDPDQRETFFGQVHEWHLMLNGKRAWIGRQS